MFFDDILIYSACLDDHLRHLELTFQVLYDNQFVLKITKYFFAQNQVEYLGHLVLHKGVEPLASKVEAIQQWPTSRTVRTVRSFLGMVGFYRCFIRGYGSIAAPLVHVTTLAEFNWSPQSQAAFDQLKQALSQALVLALPDFDLPFTIEMDASRVGMGVVLSQRNYPIAFFSKPFPPKLLCASAHIVRYS